MERPSPTGGLSLLPSTQRSFRSVCRTQAHRRQFPSHNITTLLSKQPIKSSLSTPRTDSEAGTQDHNPNIQNSNRTGFFLKTDQSTHCSYLPSALPRQGKAGQREAFLPLVLIHLCCLLSTEISPVMKHMCMPRFKENVTPSQRKKLYCLASKEKWLTINQALGSDVILMFLTAIGDLLNIQ